MPVWRALTAFAAIPLLVVSTGCMPAEITASPSAPASPEADEAQVRAGEALFAQHCQRCHISGMAGAPDLTGVDDRLSAEQFHDVVANGRRMMPAWPQLDDAERSQLWGFLSSATAANGPVAQKKTAGGGCGCGGNKPAARAAAAEPDEGSACAGASSCKSGCCNTH